MRRTCAALLAAAATTTVLGGCGSSSGYGSGGSTPGHLGSSAAGVATIGTGSGSAGTYLTAGGGRAVYLFDADGRGTSACAGACAAAWPPVLTSGTARATGSAMAGNLGTLQRPGGGRQVTYQGHPLYYFAGDGSAGQTNGQGGTAFGASWWLVAPDGTALRTASPGAGASSGRATGGYGY